VLEAIKQGGCALQHSSEDLKAYHCVVLAAVKQTTWVLSCCASEDLKADRGVVLEAIKQGGCALQHSSEDLKADRRPGGSRYECSGRGAAPR